LFALLVFQVIEAAGIACLVGAGDTLSGLWIRAGVAVFNVPLAWGFFHGFGPFPAMGFVGIALGTAVSNVLGALAVIAVLLRSLLAVSLDEESARVSGLPVPLLNGVIAVLAALTIALSMRIVGILLIAALMVLPVIAAQRIAWSMRSTMAIAIAIGLGSVLVGLTTSYYGDLPPGGTIVLAAAAFFVVASGARAMHRRV
jgi:zinc transport system permease protein